mgnify:CR=1 FL=1|tara:strand:- start:13143 stop:14087 length:945 start_codon:yes stop_codon:yes gene_type:complete
MKLLFENWRKYLKEEEILYERINLLSSNKRFVNDTLEEIASEDPRRQFPLSDEELEKIKSVAGLDGDPDFLGSGSRGSAWQFGDKVLKITADSSEARAANLLIDKEHPNVYKIFLVVQRDPKHLETLRHAPYIVVYELLDYPNNAMVDTTNNLYHKLKTNNIFYNWDENYLEKAKGSMSALLQYINKHPESLEREEKKGSDIRPTLENLAAQIGLDKLETKLLITLWIFSRGAYNDTLDSPLKALEHVREIFGSVKTNYLNQLALGLTWLNKNGIKFPDLKTSNVMEKDGQIAIIDIGYSQVREKKNIPTIGEL